MNVAASRYFFLIGCLVLPACAPTVWDKPGATQTEFTQDNGRCRLLARAMNSGSFYAEGSPGFVAGASIGNGIATAINTRETYDDCMMSRGYTPRAPSAAGTPAQTSQQQCQTAYADPAINPVRNRITMDVKDITPAMRTNPSFATAEDRLALDSWLRARKVCEGAELRALGSPQVSASYQRVLQRTDDLIAELRYGKISYGQFNTMRIENVAQGARERAAIQQQAR